MNACTGKVDKVRVRYESSTGLIDYIVCELRACVGVGKSECVMRAALL